MEIASIIISLLALAFGVYTYFAHDKRLKEQQALLNVLSINKLKRESQEQGKADSEYL
jgi:positive regulator of sigma E activity